MEEFLKKSLVQKYKYTIVIVVVDYVLPIFVYLLPAIQLKTYPAVILMIWLNQI